MTILSPLPPYSSIHFFSWEATGGEFVKTIRRNTIYYDEESEEEVHVQTCGWMAHAPDHVIVLRCIDKNGNHLFSVLSKKYSWSSCVKLPASFTVCMSKRSISSSNPYREGNKTNKMLNRYYSVLDTQIWILCKKKKPRSNPASKMQAYRWITVSHDAFWQVLTWFHLSWWTASPASQ